LGNYIKNIERIIEYKTPTQNSIIISCIIIPIIAAIIALVILTIFFIRDYSYRIILICVVALILLILFIIIWKKGLNGNNTKGLIITSDGIYLPVISNKEEYSFIQYSSITRIKVIIIDGDYTDSAALVLTTNEKEYYIELLKIKDESDRMAIIELLKRKTKITIQWSNVSTPNYVD
jgi:hypothetical protein